MECKWYIVQVASGCEEKVAASVLQGAERLGISEHFKEVLVPQEDTIRVKRNVKVVCKRKLYPGYIFIHMNMHDDAKDFIKSIRQISRFLGDSSTSPAVVSDEKIESIRKQIGQGIEDLGPSTFQVGMKVKIIDGPFSSLVGKIESISHDGKKGDGKKLAVSVLIFGRTTKVEGLGIKSVEINQEDEDGSIG